MPQDDSEPFDLDRLNAELDLEITAGNFRSGAIILDAPERIPAIWGRDHDVLWSEGEPLILAGPPGVGKTTLAQQLALARCRVTFPNVLGYPVAPATSRTLYVAADRPQQALRSMRRMVSPDQRERLDEALVVWTGPFDALADREHTLAMFRQQEIGTVIFDSVKDVAGDVSGGELGAELNRTMQLLVSAGIEVAALHHNRKGQEGNRRPKRLDDLYGSQWIAAGAGSVVYLWGEAGDREVELLHLKQPDNVVGPLNVVHDHRTGTSTVAERVDDETETLRLACIAALDEGEPLGKKRLIEKVRELGISGGQGKLKEQITKLAATPGSGIHSRGNDGYVKGGTKQAVPPLSPPGSEGGTGHAPLRGSLTPRGQGDVSPFCPGRSTTDEPTNQPNGGPPPMPTTDQFAQIVAQLDPLPAGRRESIARMATEEVATCPRCGQSVRRCDPRRHRRPARPPRLRRGGVMDRWRRPTSFPTVAAPLDDTSGGMGNCWGPAEPSNQHSAVTPRNGTEDRVRCSPRPQARRRPRPRLPTRPAPAPSPTRSGSARPAGAATAPGSSSDRDGSIPDPSPRVQPRVPNHRRLDAGPTPCPPGRKRRPRWQANDRSRPQLRRTTRNSTRRGKGDEPQHHDPRRRCRARRRDPAGERTPRRPARRRAAGLCRGELQALDWNQVELNAGVIRVEHFWDRVVGLAEPKSRARERSVPIPQALAREQRALGPPGCRRPPYPRGPTGRSDQPTEWRTPRDERNQRVRPDHRPTRSSSHWSPSPRRQRAPRRDPHLP